MNRIGYHYVLAGFVSAISFLSEHFLASCGNYVRFIQCIHHTTTCVPWWLSRYADFLDRIKDIAEFHVHVYIYLLTVRCIILALCAGKRVPADCEWWYDNTPTNGSDVKSSRPKWPRGQNFLASASASASASRFWPRPGLDPVVLLCNRAFFVQKSCKIREFC